MFQIDTDFLIFEIKSISPEARIPIRRPGIPYDFEMLLTIEKNSIQIIELTH